MRSIYKKVDGVWQWLPGDSEAAESMSAAVHQDTMPALRHPVTGHVYESKSAYLRACKRHGLTIVGNDLLSSKPSAPPDKITEAKVIDAIQKTEAIMSDPARRNELRYKNERILDEYKKTIGNR
jgi:hypothetical protein